MKHFRHYLRTIFPPDPSADQLIPLLAMNPMGKDHVTALLDAYLAMDADAIGARTATEAAARLADVPGKFKVGHVVVDDLLGGGTNRYDTLTRTTCGRALSACSGMRRHAPWGSYHWA
jgi:hypothetical protein